MEFLAKLAEVLEHQVTEACYGLDRLDPDPGQLSSSEIDAFKAKMKAVSIAAQKLERRADELAIEWMATKS